jgi:hypothetical protein
MSLSSDPIEPAPPVLPRPRRIRAVAIASGVFLLMLGVTAFFAFSRLHGRGRRASVVIASFRADFQENTPKERWKYMWNANGPVGTPSYYAELRWNGNVYTVDPAAYPAAPPARYLRLARGSGHPGQGPTQGREVGNEEERCVIVAFTVPDRGSYWITQSVLSRHIGSRSGNVHLRVFVNDREVGPVMTCQSKEGLSFDRELGMLSAGDTIYVSVGPNEVDMDDSFDLDFAISL